VCLIRVNGGGGGEEEEEEKEGEGGGGEEEEEREPEGEVRHTRCHFWSADQEPLVDMWSPDPPSWFPTGPSHRPLPTGPSP